MIISRLDYCSAPLGGSGTQQSVWSAISSKGHMLYHSSTYWCAPATRSLMLASRVTSVSPPSTWTQWCSVCLTCCHTQSSIVRRVETMQYNNFSCSSTTHIAVTILKWYIVQAQFFYDATRSRSVCVCVWRGIMTRSQDILCPPAKPTLHPILSSQGQELHRGEGWSLHTWQNTPYPPLASPLLSLSFSYVPLISFPFFQS